MKSSGFLRAVNCCFLLIVPLYSGCSRQGLTISGTVTYEDQAVEDGFISFVPDDGRGPTFGAPIKEGKYELQGLTPGKKHIEITASSRYELPKGSPDPAQVKPGPAAAAPPPLIPVDAVGNNQTIEVTSSTSKLDFHLKKPPTK
jgi:hypothetical protein